MKLQFDNELDLNLRNVQLRITSFYKFLYQINDLILGIIFLIGSFLFFSESTTFYGTILFVIGSVQMLIRPVISIVHDIHISKVKQQMDNDRKKAPRT
ncbi:MULTISPECIES: YrhK family protein [Gracilibacillus]|uniref:YrhK family protein n=1 Tax=Gracilibacillus TaxID=74385 RepID=UPI000826800D|nr:MULTISPECIES: YrhK family protein [Gracilibacillus]